MPLQATEQIIYDYISSDVSRREFWSSQAQEAQSLAPDKHQAAIELEKRLIAVYVADEEALSEIGGLVTRLQAMTCNWRSVAFKLMGLDLEDYLRSIATPRRETAANSQPSHRESSSIPPHLAGIVTPSGEALARARKELGRAALESMTDDQRIQFDRIQTQAQWARIEAQQLERLRTEVAAGNTDKRPEQRRNDGYSNSLGCLLWCGVIALVIIAETLWERVTFFFAGFLLIGLIVWVARKIEGKIRKPEEPPKTTREQIEEKINEAFTKFGIEQPSANLSREAFRTNWLQKHRFPLDL